MDYNLLLENIRIIVDNAEHELVFTLKENMEGMYWAIGFELKNFKTKEIRKVITKLSRDLVMNRAIFELSYDYYRNHAVHSLRRSK